MRQYDGPTMVGENYGNREISQESYTKLVSSISQSPSMSSRGWTITSYFYFRLLTIVKEIVERIGTTARGIARVNRKKE